MQPPREVDLPQLRRPRHAYDEEEPLERARTVVDLVSLQNQYSPWHRQLEDDGTLAYCEREDLAFIPWSPLGGSSRAERLSDIEALAELSEAKGISPQRLVIAWLMVRSPAVLPIPASTNPDHATDTLRAYAVDLSDEEVARLDDVA